MISSYEKDFNNYFKESDLTFSQLKLKAETPTIVKIDEDLTNFQYNIYDEAGKQYHCYNSDNFYKLNAIKSELEDKIASDSNNNDFSNDAHSKLINNLSNNVTKNTMNKEYDKSFNNVPLDKSTYNNLSNTKFMYNDNNLLDDDSNILDDDSLPDGDIFIIKEMLSLLNTKENLD